MLKLQVNHVLFLELAIQVKMDLKFMLTEAIVAIFGAAILEAGKEEGIVP